MRPTPVIVLAFVAAVAIPHIGTGQTLSASVASVLDRVPLPSPAPEAGLPEPLTMADAAQAPAQGPTAPPPRAFEYSDGYHTRAKIHKIASFATLPLFATQGFLGQSIYNDPTDGKKTAHTVVAASIGGLFALNTTTGVWNLMEARKDPNFKTRRLVHGLLMLGSDAGFVATFATAPGDDRGEREEEGGGDGHSASMHRALAFTSIGLATTGYLIMLFGAH